MQLSPTQSKLIVFHPQKVGCQIPIDLTWIKAIENLLKVQLT